jgi:hypothetical protein
LDLGTGLDPLPQGAYEVIRVKTYSLCNYSGAGPASVGGEEACGGGVGVDVDIE